MRWASRSTALAEFPPALKHLDHVIINHDPMQPGALSFGQDPKVVCLSQAAWALWVHGYPDEARKRNDEALALAQKLSHPYSLAAALNFGSIVHQFNQDSSGDREARRSRDQAFDGTRICILDSLGFCDARFGNDSAGTARSRDRTDASRYHRLPRHRRTGNGPVFSWTARSSIWKGRSCGRRFERVG